jgi:hypothetical protein
MGEAYGSKITRISGYNHNQDLNLFFNMWERQKGISGSGLFYLK